MRKYLTKALLTLLLCLAGTLWMPAMRAEAAAIGTVEEFDNMGGSAAYINHSDRYYLDMEETGLVDGMGASILNYLANMVFAVIKWLAGATVVIFYNCMDFDLAQMFREQINGIQRTLNSGIFMPLFTLGCCGSAVILLKKMFRRDLMGAFGQILKVIGIVILSVLIVKESATVLSCATSITKAASTQALVGMQEQEVTTASFSAQSAAALWGNLVHDPWVFMQFDGDPVDEDIIYEFLDEEANSNERKELVEDYDGDAFSKDRAWEKAGFMALYLIIMLPKCIIYILMSMLSMVFQLIAIFYVLMAPVVLILTMMPGYDGLINAWLQKMLESQLSVLIISFVIGLLVKFDNMLYSVCAGWGWLVVLLVQVVMEVMVVYKRNDLLGAFSKLQKRVAPNTSRAMMMRGADSFQLSERGIRTSEKALHTVISKGYDLTVQGTAALKKRLDGISAYFEGEESGGETASSGRAERRQSPVERPVMSEGQQLAVQEQPVITRAVMRRNASVSAQEPQREVKRPRMYENANESNVVQFEAYRGRKVVGGENDAGYAGPTQGADTVTRPSMDADVESSEGIVYSPQPEKSARPRKRQSAAGQEQPLQDRELSKMEKTSSTNIRHFAMSADSPGTSGEEPSVTRPVMGDGDGRTETFGGGQNENLTMEQPAMAVEPLATEKRSQSSSVTEHAEKRQKSTAEKPSEERAKRSEKNEKKERVNRTVSSSTQRHPRESISVHVQEQRMGREPVKRPMSSVASDENG